MLEGCPKAALGSSFHFNISLARGPSCEGGETLLQPVCRLVDLYIVPL